MSFVIRPIQDSAADAQAWSALRHRLWPHAGPAELLAEARAFVSGASVPAIACAFIAEDPQTKRILGFIELSIRPFADGCDSQPVAHVEGWYVEPPARNRGIARALLNEAEAWARARGFTELASDTQLENEESLAVHVRCGFAETERLVKLRKALPDTRSAGRRTATHNRARNIRRADA